MRQRVVYVIRCPRTQSGRTRSSGSSATAKNGATIRTLSSFGSEIYNKPRRNTIFLTFICYLSSFFCVRLLDVYLFYFILFYLRDKVEVNLFFFNKNNFYSFLCFSCSLMRCLYATHRKCEWCARQLATKKRKIAFAWCQQCMPPLNSIKSIISPRYAVSKP